MTVVSDTSPLNYLVLTELDHLLPALFGRIIIPNAVDAELRSPAAPETLRRWLEERHPWLEVHPAPSFAEAELRNLDFGEREVIVLGVHLRANLVLLDEAKGRQMARRRGLTVAGTLGVLERAAQRGFVDLNDAIHRLQRTTFRASPKLLESLRQRR